jgi:hypothetical protein
MNRIFPKSSYYDAFAEPKVEKALFNSRNTLEHGRLRRTQAALYSMTNVKSYESFVDTQTVVLNSKMEELAKLQQTVSLPSLLQKYAFDVIGAITVSPASSIPFLMYSSWTLAEVYSTSLVNLST